MSSPDPAATTGRRIVFHSLLNVVGTGAPLLVAVVAIPILIDRLGTERFGVLTIVWLFVGYLSLFDFGIGRALTKLVAERRRPEEHEEVAALARTGLLMMTGFGVLGALATAGLASWLVHRALLVPVELQPETLQAVWLLALALPVVTVSAGLRGLLEAYERFDLVNLVRTPLGVATFAGPLLVLPFTHHLVAVVGILVAARSVAAFAQWIFVRRLLPQGSSGNRVDRAFVPLLLRFGGWMTVSSVVSPLMVYLDRFVIGAMLGMTAVAFYATPYEIVTKLWLVPGAVLSVLFPAFSAGIRHRDPRMPRIFGTALLAVFLLLAPITLLIVTYGAEGLRLWVGEEFARNSAVVLQWLAAGVLINSVGQVAFTVVQSAGRPDITAKLHLAELPFYLVAFWYLASRYGIEGAAMAWAIRVAVDTLLLLAVVPRVLPGAEGWLRRLAPGFAVALGLLTLGATLGTPLPKAIFVGAVLTGGLPAAWLLLLDGGQRTALRSRLRLRRGSAV